MNDHSKSLWLPPALAREYTVLSCLKYSEQSATYLLRSFDSGKTVLLKTTSDALFAEALINEKNILDLIHQQESPLADSFPRNIPCNAPEPQPCSPAGLLREDTEDGGSTFYYIRTYIKGTTLEDLCESNLKKAGDFFFPGLKLRHPAG